MFKYKSPLSRLLEGSAKHANKDDSHEDDRDEATEEPIADLNALRQVLAGGNLAAEAESEAEDPAEELIAEDIQIDEIRAQDIAPLVVEDVPQDIPMVEDSTPAETMPQMQL